MKWLILFSWLCMIAEIAGGQIPTIRLLSQDQKQVALRDVAQGKPVLVVLLGTTCPICQKYAGLFAALPEQYPQIQFVGVFTKWELFEEIAQFKTEYGINFPLLVDKKHKLIKKLGATTTPEVFLMDGQWRVLYRGAINNWFYALGKARPVVTENYLRDALDAFLAGKDIAIKQTKPIGCVVED